MEDVSREEDILLSKYLRFREECVIFCIDNSLWTNAEDVNPSRWLAQLDAVRLIIDELESDKQFGIISTSGKRANVHLPPTKDRKRILEYLNTLNQSGEICHNSDALLLAQMCFSNLENKEQNRRIILFIASELKEDIEKLKKSSSSFLQNKIMLDIIDFGDISTSKSKELTEIVRYIGKDCNLITFEQGEQLLCNVVSNTLYGQKHNSKIPWKRVFGFKEENNKNKKTKELDIAMSKSLQHNIPVLGTTPAMSGGCRRNILDKQRYKVISRMKAVPMQVLAMKRDNATIFIIKPHPSSKKCIASFKAGMMKYGENKIVVPLKRKGELSLWLIHDSMLVLRWKSIVHDAHELEIKLFPLHGTAHFMKISKNTNKTDNKTDTDNTSDNKADVFLLEIKMDDSVFPKRHFFWSQESLTSDRPSEFCFVFLNQLNNLRNMKQEIPLISEREMVDQSIAELEKALSSESSDVNFIGKKENHRIIIRREKSEDSDVKKAKKAFLEGILGDNFFNSLEESRSKFRSKYRPSFSKPPNELKESNGKEEKGDKEWVPDLEDSKSDSASELSKLLSILELMRQLEKKE